MDKVLLTTTVISKDVHNVLRVRGGNGKKGSKKGTKAQLGHFARAEQNYSQGVQTDKISVNKPEELCKLWRGAQNIIGFNQLAPRFDRKTGETTVSKLLPRKKVTTLPQTGTFNKNALIDANHVINSLFRKILTFKGHSEAQLYKNYQKNGVQTYNVNTYVYLNRLQAEGEVTDNPENFAGFNISKITVKRVSKNIEAGEIMKGVKRKVKHSGKIIEVQRLCKFVNVSYSILFCSQDCRKINQYLQNSKTFL